MRIKLMLMAVKASYWLARKLNGDRKAAMALREMFDAKISAADGPEREIWAALRDEILNNGRSPLTSANATEWIEGLRLRGVTMREEIPEVNAADLGRS